MSDTKTREGLAPFSYPNLPKECHTWYQIHGDLKSTTARPLVVVHGGPGSTHTYMLPLEDLADHFNIPVVFYDALGCGNSTRIREKRLDTSFWTADLFMAELENLLQHLGISENFDLLGQSWGGMLSALFASSRRAVGLKKLVISNSPASVDLWVDACNRSRLHLPSDVNAVLEKHERAMDFDNQDYKDACVIWLKKFMCRTDPWPDYVMKSFELMEEDDTVYFTMNGPSEFTVIGSLRDFSLLDKVQNINVPTLVIRGEYDSADEAGVAPFLEGIKDVKSFVFPDCSHMSHVENRKLYMEVVHRFLAGSD